MSFKIISDSLNLDLESISEDQLLYINKLTDEFISGFKLINSVGNLSATFYGGSRVVSGGEDFKLACQISDYLAKKNFTIITGGGPGIMEAGINSAVESGSRAIGVGINIKHEPSNSLATDFLMFESFAARKFFLRSSDLLFFFKGGIGTLDELFEILTLIDTGKLISKKIFLCNTDFYKPILDSVISAKDNDVSLVSQDLVNRFNYIDSVEDLKQFIK
jgi:uncharacterized protein (TIGR00730 family)